VALEDIEVVVEDMDSSRAARLRSITGRPRYSSDLCQTTSHQIYANTLM
jgi:hypothetical protein